MGSPRINIDCREHFTSRRPARQIIQKMYSMTKNYADTLTISQKAKFSRDFSKAYRDTECNKQDWENVKFNNLKFKLPLPTEKTGFARKAELYLKHGILK